MSRPQNVKASFGQICCDELTLWHLRTLEKPLVRVCGEAGPSLAWSRPVLSESTLHRFPRQLTKREPRDSSVGNTRKLGTQTIKKKEVMRAGEFRPPPPTNAAYRREIHPTRRKRKRGS
ncbi:unnamed protein product [Ixodes pacificus]